jgi:hypothetical protein
MQTLTDKAANVWLNQLGIVMDSQRNLRFTGGEPSTIHLSNKSPAELSLNLTGILDSEKGWLLWLTDFSIWSNEIEEIGWMIIEKVLQSKLELDSSAFLFGPQEHLNLKAVLMVVLLFEWDAFLMNADGKTFVLIDHDHEITVSTINEELANEIRSSQLETWITR